MTGTRDSNLSNGFKETEIGPIPVEWEVVQFDKLCQLGRENVDPQELPAMPYVGLEHIESGEPKLRRWGNSSEVKSSKNHFVPGDVLYGKLRPYLDKAVLAEFEGVCSTDILVLKANLDFTTPEFLAHTLHTQQFLSYAISTTSGTNLPRTRWTSLKDFELALPPLPEQRRIAHVLSTIQRAIAAQDALIAAARELKRSLMQRLFTYGPGPEPAPTKETEIGEIPEHWEVMRLGEVAIVKYGNAKPKTEGNVPVVGSGGTYYWTDQALVDYPTLVIGRKGTAGRVWLLEIPCWPADTTFYLEWKKPVDIKFLFGYLTLNPLSGEHARTTLPSLQRPELEKCPIPFPPLLEQREIARMLSAMDRKIEAEEQRKAALQALFKAMLHQLMTGQIRLRDVE